jgi:hypothetical protein
MTTDRLPTLQCNDRLAEWLLIGLIVSAVFLQKIIIPIGSGEVIFLGFFVLMGLTGTGLLFRRLEINPVRAVLYLGAMSVMVSMQFFHLYHFSMPSLLMLCLVHFPYVCQIRPGLARPQAALHFYQKIMAVVAILGILQFVAQYVIGPYYAFFMDQFLLAHGLAPEFNYMNPIRLGHPYYKSNGIFMLEPSFFCQFLAVSVVIEMVVFRNWKRLCIYVAGIVVTFSGTGLMILFLLAPVYLLQRGNIGLLTAMGTGLLSSPIWAPLIGLGRQVERIAEFSNTHSSGFARFISIFWVIKDFLFPDFSLFIFGAGAGTINEVVPDAVDYTTFDPTWGKLVFEYGILGALAYMTFFFGVLSTSTATRYLKAALALVLLLMGGYLIPPVVHGLIIALLVWPAADVSSNEKTAQVNT